MHFSRYGRLVDVVVMSKQGRPRGFGFVRFEDSAAAAVALAEPQWVDGRFVDVKCAVPGEQPEERTPNKIFVGGLPQDVSTDDLKACFGHYGRIVDAVVMVDRRTKRSRGFGFIRFASGAQGARAAEAVMNAANHQLGGKWVEVKQATPAALLQDTSPNSTRDTCSPIGTPTSHQKQHVLLGQQLHHPKQQYLSAGLRCGGTPQDRRLPQVVATGMVDSYPARCALERRFFDHGVWEHAAYGFGMDSGATRGAAGFASPFSPMRPYAGELTVFNPVASDGAHTDFHVYEDDVEGPLRKQFSFTSNQSDEDADENRPGAVNRAVTPPPGRLAKKPLNLPPGLSIMASPMKIECDSKEFEDLAGGAGLVGLAHFDGLIKVQPRRAAV